MVATKHIVGICGSLRELSNNRGLLRAFGRTLPAEIGFQIADLSDLPFFNEDREQPLPGPVLRLKEMLDNADAVVISSPEYNLSYTGVLKNALEWISRRAVGMPMAGKPVALMGAALIGVGVSQSHLRDVMFGMNVNLLTRPIVQIGNARERFDAQGNPTDPAIQELLVKLRDEIVKVIN